MSGERERRVQGLGRIETYDIMPMHLSNGSLSDMILSSRKVFTCWKIGNNLEGVECQHYNLITGSSLQFKDKNHIPVHEQTHPPEDSYSKARNSI